MPPPSSAGARRGTCWTPARRRSGRPTRAAPSRSPRTRSVSGAGCPCCTRWSFCRDRSKGAEMATTVSGVEITGAMEERFEEVLSDGAVAFVSDLHRRFDGRRRELLARREERQRELDDGGTLDFLPETREVRQGEWQVAPPPPDLRRRRVEITGPTNRKMVINALNSGAEGFMADFEDSNSPTWHNVIGGHVNLTDAIERTIELEEG